jgi:hypothetical protein
VYIDRNGILAMMKHFGFLVKVKFKDGEVRHFARQRLASTRAEALKIIKTGFDKDNVYIPGSPKDNWADLIEILEVGECPEGQNAEGNANSIDLYEAVCIKGAKLDKKDKKAVPAPSSKLAQGSAQLLTVN